MAVFVLDRNHQPLMPCTEKRAGLLLDRGRARIHKIEPYTIRLIDRTVADCVLQPLAIRIDPGSKTTGLALVRLEQGLQNAPAGQEQPAPADALDKAEAAAPVAHVLWLAELEYRGDAIRKALAQRATFRRSRRSRKTRYRAARFLNRHRPEGWLPPSLRHRVETTLTWARRLSRLAPVTSIDVEAVRFDTQLLQDPQIAGVGYQQGELAGYEVREYVLERDGRTCVYCDAEDAVLEVDHVVPRSKGGTNRVSNLTCACVDCNRRKGSQDLEAFLAGDPGRAARIRQRLKAALNDAAAVNATRPALVRMLACLGVSVRSWSGGRTKWNRSRLGVPKDHALDAACVGEAGSLEGWLGTPVACIRATGRGSRKRTRLDRHGAVRGYLAPGRHVQGFRTGDLVRAEVAKGKKAGTYVGRVAVRASGSFNIQARSGTVQGISWKHCRLVQRADGYGYGRRTGTPPKFSNSKEAAFLSPPQGSGCPAAIL